MISKYFEFINEKNLDLIKESMVYFSQKLREDLQTLSLESGVVGNIALDLLKVKGTNPENIDMTFVDVDVRDGLLNYKKMDSMIRDIQKAEFDENSAEALMKLKDEYDEGWGEFLVNTSSWAPSRNTVKLNKFINTFYPNKYQAGEIEQFTNSFKALQRGEAVKVEIVEGEEIKKWYLQSNYFKVQSTLGDSCMRYDRCQDYFDIYTKNPDVCKLACVFQNDEAGNKKLTARAILWKVTEKDEGNFEWFMDRQYAITDAEINVLRKWADRQKYAYKTQNSFGSYKLLTLGGNQFYCDMKIQLGDFDYVKFPYMDTFKRFEPIDKILYNDDEEKEGFYVLDSTSGGFTSKNVVNTVYSDWLGEEIPEDDSVYSRHVDSYLREEDAVQVDMGSNRYRGWWPASYDDIVEDFWSGDYMHINDSVYSDRYDGYLLRDYSLSAVHEIDDRGNCNVDEYWISEDDQDFISYYKSKIEETFWFQHLSQRRHSAWEDQHAIDKILITKDYKDKWILKQMAIDVYDAEENELGIELIDESASLVLGIGYTGEKKLWEIFEYVNTLESSIDLEELENKARDLRINSNEEDKQKIDKLLNMLRIY